MGKSSRVLGFFCSINPFKNNILLVENAYKKLFCYLKIEKSKK